MKKFFTVMTILLLIVITTHAQVPQAFKYQAVVRDTSGIVLADKLISLKVSILQGSINGQVVYSETHDVVTNSLGLINLEIGRGTLVEGEFSQISWGDDSHFIRLEIDPEGAMNYHLLGTSELLAVPYALYAEKSGTGPGNDTTIYVNNDTTIYVNNDTTIYTTESKWKDAPNGIYYNEGNVGIGTTMPESKLQIEGTSNMLEGRDFLWLKNNSTDIASNVWLQLSSGGDSYTAIHHTGDYYTLMGEQWIRHTLIWNHGRGMIFRTGIPGNFYFEFYDGHATHEFARMTSDGYFGIGTSTPARPLQVRDVIRLEPRETPPENPAEGDIYMDVIDHHLKVYDGTEWQSCW